MDKCIGWSLALFSGALSALIAGCAGLGEHQETTAIPGGFPGRLAGYLALADLPKSVALIPPAPAPGSPAQALDDEISHRSFALRDTPRWTLAAADAKLSFPHAAGIFSCALNAPVNATDTPRLYRLLERSLTDLGETIYGAKILYQRPRPFVVNKAALCTPEAREWLRKEGSYPSAHSAAGWGWALILAEISPPQADALLQRGLSFGESRNVCNVHWYSDVAQARTLAAATVARLHTTPAFRADVDAARAELAAVRARGLPPEGDCAAEAQALATTPSLAP